MKKILAFSGSNYSKSINQELVSYTASLLNHDVKVINIFDWDIPVYSIDMDPDVTPQRIKELLALIQEYDGFILSTPEHNGSIPAFLKNIIDWISRRSKKVFEGKPLFLMSTSPGARGAASSREQLERLLPYIGVQVAATFSLPSFHENMKEGTMNSLYKENLEKALTEFSEVLG